MNPATFPLAFPETPLTVSAREVVRALTGSGHAAYFAGGCVRDALLGRAEQDIDIATDATPDQVQKLFPRVTDLQGKNFGVVRVMRGPWVFEIATFRKDGAYQDGRRPDHVTFTTAEEDARRRDFTVNGLFYDPLTLTVLDYVGGRADLDSKTLRCIGSPSARFGEDYLRMFRAARFAAELDFAIEPETWRTLTVMSPKTVALAPERVRDELVRALCGSHPLKAFDLLDQAGLFRAWLPEVEALKGVAQPPQFHPEGDVFVHTRLMVGGLPARPDLTLTLSVLLHDIAKPDTHAVDDTGRIRFNGHEAVGAAKAEKILRRLRFSNEQIEAVTMCVAGHMMFKDAPKMRLSTLKRFLARPWFEQELELHRLDCASSHGSLDIHEMLKEKRAAFSQEEVKPRPLVNGHDLIKLGLPPGRQLGKLLTLLMDEQLEGRFADRDAALARAGELAGRC
ncbi:MAG: CCA tRNA nucleotidyltransferase [Verrucomicrobiales bacterium]|jgi:poly(A) polymerase|nr:CCA tRNA nucleotidyltransferase [Verrucomicrobiales bacterium]